MTQTDFQYIHFVKIEQKPKTSVWSCVTNRTDRHLGLVGWYGPWRAYCFFPEADTVYNQGCLKDIQAFIEGLGA